MRKVGMYKTFTMYHGDDQRWYCRQMGEYRTYGPFRTAKGLFTFINREARGLQRRAA